MAATSDAKLICFVCFFFFMNLRQDSHVSDRECCLHVSSFRHKFNINQPLRVHPHFILMINDKIKSNQNVA